MNISIFIVGLLLWFFAAWSKLTHQSFDALMINISFGVIAIAGILTVVKILFNKDDKFLNR